MYGGAGIPAGVQVKAPVANFRRFATEAGRDAGPTPATFSQEPRNASPTARNESP